MRPLPNSFFKFCQAGCVALFLTLIIQSSRQILLVKIVFKMTTKLGFRDCRTILSLAKSGMM
jgi:hypothetical protein